jgi:hypothetical protein
MTPQRPSDLLERYAPAPQPVPETLLGDLSGRSADVVRLVPRRHIARWLIPAAAAATVAGLVILSTASSHQTGSPAASPAAAVTGAPVPTSAAPTTAFTPLTAAPATPPTAPPAPVAGQVLYEEWWSPGGRTSAGTTTEFWIASDGSRWVRDTNGSDPTLLPAPTGYLSQVATLPSDPRALTARMRQLLGSANSSDSAVFAAYADVLTDGRATLPVRQAVVSAMRMLSGVTVRASRAMGGAPCTLIERLSAGKGNLYCITEPTATLVETGETKNGQDYADTTLATMVYVPAVPADVRNSATTSPTRPPIGYVMLNPLTAPSYSPVTPVLAVGWATKNVLTATYTLPDGTRYSSKTTWDGSYNSTKYAPDNSVPYLSATGIADLPTDVGALDALLRQDLQSGASDASVFTAYQAILWDGRAQAPVRTAILQALRALPSTAAVATKDVADRTCTRFAHPLPDGTVSFVCIDESTGLMIETGTLAGDGSVASRSDLAVIKYVAEVPAPILTNAKPA